MMAESTLRVVKIGGQRKGEVMVLTWLSRKGLDARLDASARSLRYHYQIHSKISSPVAWGERTRHGIFCLRVLSLRVSIGSL